MCSYSHLINDNQLSTLLFICLLNETQTNLNIDLLIFKILKTINVNI